MVAGAKSKVVEPRSAEKCNMNVVVIFRAGRATYGTRNKGADLAYVAEH